MNDTQIDVFNIRVNNDCHRGSNNKVILTVHDIYSSRSVWATMRLDLVNILVFIPTWLR